LRAPAESVVLPARSATDSSSGRIVGANFELAYDFGLYSNPLDDRVSKPGYRVRVLEIDGRTAKLVSHDLVDSGGRFIGIHFTRIESTPIGPLLLTVTSTGGSEEKLAEIETIYRSIRIVGTRPRTD
jgi:hypothetical protein